MLSRQAAGRFTGPEAQTTWPLLSRRMVGVGNGEQLNPEAEFPSPGGEWRVKK